jgi:hypothetical protein
MSNRATAAFKSKIDFSQWHRNVFPLGDLARRKEEIAMTKIRLVSALMILTAITAAPVLAGDAGVLRPGHGMKHHHHARAHQVFRGAYNQSYRQTDPDPELQRNIDNFGFSGRDPSRIGGVDPDLNPAGGGI